jgi:hypothetical protein
MLLVLVGLIVGGAWGAWKVITIPSPQVAATIVAGVVTVLVSVFSVLWSKRVERQREIEQEQRQQKIPVYEEFIAFLFRILLADKLGEQKVTEQEMMKFVSGFAQKIMIWGSDDVLHRYAVFRRMGSATGLETVVAVESLLFAIRADVGHRNKNLKTGDLLSIFVNDIESFLEKPAQ